MHSIIAHSATEKSSPRAVTQVQYDPFCWVLGGSLLARSRNLPLITTSSKKSSASRCDLTPIFFRDAALVQRPYLCRCFGGVGLPLRSWCARGGGRATALSLATVSPAGCPVDHEDGSNSNSNSFFWELSFRRFSASSIAPGNWSYGRAPAWCGVGVYGRAFKLSKWLLRLCAVASLAGRSL